MPATFKHSEFPLIRRDTLQDLPTENKVTAKQVDFTGAVLFEENTPAESVPLLATIVCSNHLPIRRDSYKEFFYIEQGINLAARFRRRVSTSDRLEAHRAQTVVWGNFIRL